MDTIYLDNAATTWPKPPEVINAMTEFLREYAANPGRGSHQMSVKAGRVVFECRNNLSKLFGIKNPNDIAFALNTTSALNQAIRGFVKPGQHVISTGIEHNSVRRPLEYLRKLIGIEITYLKTDPQGNIKLDDLEKAIQSNTSLVVCNHSSNLMGTILPVAEIGEICRKHKVCFLVDAAQSAGHLEINVEHMGIDMLAFPGHKGLFGPQGTGGLYISPDLELEPLLLGGTGSQSELVEQPTVRPDRYESGTLNAVGIAGLNEGVKFILKETVKKIHEKEWALTQQLMKEIAQVKGLKMLGPELGENKTGIVAFQIENADSSEIAFILDQSFGIAVRAGYHCTPLAHQTAGTFDNGAVRASVSYFTTEHEIEQMIAAVKEISKHYSR